MTHLRGRALWAAATCRSTLRLVAEHYDDPLHPAGWHHGLHAPAGPPTLNQGDVVLRDNLAEQKSPEVLHLVGGGSRSGGSVPASPFTQPQSH